MILFSFSFFLETKTAREKSHRKYSDREKHQELGKLSGGTRQTRILNKRKAFIICQKFLYLLCLPTERAALFGGPSLSVKRFTLNWEAHKVLLTCFCYWCYPWKCRAPGLPAAKAPGLRAGDLRPRRHPQLLLDKLCPPHFGEGRAPADRAKGVPAPSLDTGTKPKLF